MCEWVVTQSKIKSSSLQFEIYIYLHRYIHIRLYITYLTDMESILNFLFVCPDSYKYIPSFLNKEEITLMSIKESYMGKLCVDLSIWKRKITRQVGSVYVVSHIGSNIFSKLILLVAYKWNFELNLCYINLYKIIQNDICIPLPPVGDYSSKGHCLHHWIYSYLYMFVL